MESFDLTQIKKGSLIHIVGPRAVGKTTIILNIIDKLEPDNVIVYKAYAGYGTFQGQAPEQPQPKRQRTITTICNTLTDADLDNLNSKNATTVVVIEEYMLRQNNINVNKLLDLQCTVIIEAQFQSNFYPELQAKYNYTILSACSTTNQLCSQYSHIENFRNIYTDVTSVKYRLLLIDHNNGNRLYSRETRLKL